ncbi:type II toxin-antitoxin system VapC family toxin [Microbacterium sp. F2]|uniref:type II toxin-antitoxin system VapC family toxin n=1 Tax=Microbacterium sp. F2 TaxID=3422228 RepID=UPI003FD03E62
MTTDADRAASALVVLDASAVVAMIASGGDLGDRIAARLADATLLAPHLLPTEVDSALRGLERGGRISTAQADAARGLFAQFPIDLWPWHLLADRAWQLRANATTYDAGYVALAELTGATLLTCDARLQSIPRSSARVEVFA